MTPDETKIQNEKVRLMKTAMILGAIWGLFVLAALFQIVENTSTCK